MKDKRNLVKSFESFKSSHHIAGFWSHIEWVGNIGTDQHGRKWENPKEPRLVNGHEVFKAIAETTKDLIELTTKAKLI